MCCRMRVGNSCRIFVRGKASSWGRGRRGSWRMEVIMVFGKIRNHQIFSRKKARLKYRSALWNTNSFAMKWGVRFAGIFSKIQYSCRAITVFATNVSGSKWPTSCSATKRLNAPSAKWNSTTAIWKEWRNSMPFSVFLISFERIISFARRSRNRSPYLILLPPKKDCLMRGNKMPEHENGRVSHHSKIRKRNLLRHRKIVLEKRVFWIRIAGKMTKKMNYQKMIKIKQMTVLKKHNKCRLILW